MKRSRILSVLPILFVAASCGSDATTSDDGSLPEPDVTVPAETTPVDPADTTPASDPAVDELAGDTVVFVWTETGGCAMGGPNCARYEVTVDGTVNTFRADGESAEAELTGEIDPALVQTWRDALQTDLDELRERVGEGEMTAAFDGVDYVVSNPATGVELNSVESDFDESEPVFSAAFAIAQAARDAAPLEMEMR